MEPFSVFSLHEVLLVSIEEEIDDASIRTLVEVVRSQVSRQKLSGVIVDLQHLEVMDSFLSDHMQKLARSLKLLQAPMIISGMSVPMVMTLLDFNIRLPDIEFALDVEQALILLHRNTR